MGHFFKLKFTTKMFVVITLVIVATIVIITGNALRVSNGEMTQLALNTISESHKGMLKALEVIDSNVRNKLDVDMISFEEKIELLGGLHLDESEMLSVSMVHQITKASSAKDIPSMKIDDSTVLGDYKVVDEMGKKIGSSLTIFQLVEDKLLRISTTVKKKNGERAVGTYIPSSSQVYKTIMGGQVYRGKAYVVNEWYLTAYKPLYNVNREIIGAIYAGQPILSPQVRTLLTENKVGTGYYFVYHDDGTYLVHPTKTSAENVYEILPEFKGVHDGFVHYVWDDKPKTSITQRMDKWGMFLGLGVHAEDIIGKSVKKVIYSSVLIGALVLVGGILLTLTLVRTINRPLKELADKAEQVGAGDYTISFAPKADDAIGQLTGSLHTMVEQGKVMLGDIARSSTALTAASGDISTLAQQMVSNADKTTDVADNAAGGAQNVSDNMGVVSATMEQSASNIDMIAAASEEMGTTIKEIAENSSKARVITEEAVNSAEKSHHRVVKLGEAAKDIGSITETITEISEQTNLLALNATIEAARAGEAGKGFAVVANEIKDLAKQTAEATSRIKQAIEGIQDGTTETVENIETVTTIINSVDEVVAGVVSAVEEQSITTNEIVNNVAQASLGIGEVNENVASSNEMAQQVTTDVEEVKEQSLEVKASCQQVEKSAEELAGLAQQLTEVISRFTIQ